VVRLLSDGYACLCVCLCGLLAAFDCFILLDPDTRIRTFMLIWCAFSADCDAMAAGKVFLNCSLTEAFCMAIVEAAR